MRVFTCLFINFCLVPQAPGATTFDAGLGPGLVPLTPEVWIDLSLSHIRHAQLAAVRQFPQGWHDAALLLHSLAKPRSTLQIPCRLPSCGLVPRLGGLGH